MVLSLTLFVAIFGCQSKENISTETTDNQSTNIEDNEKLLVDSDFDSVSVSKLNSVDEITFDDNKTIDAFQRIFSSAVKVVGIVDMAAPEFNLKVGNNKENHQSFYLWIGEKGQRSTFMNTEDTHTIYTVSKEETEKLIELVESR